MGFLPFALIPLHLRMAFITWNWGGFVQGFEFSVIDAIAIALYFGTRCSPRPVPFKLSMALYFIAVLLSTLQARAPTAALFYPWQLGRMFLIYAVVARGVSTDPRVAPALLKGMAAGLVMEACVAGWQRFGLGILQPTGTFSGQNLLGLTSHFVVFPFVALLFSGPSVWLPSVVALAGIVIEALTTSRATLGIAGFGFATVFILSTMRQIRKRNLVVLLITTMMIPIVAPSILSSFEQRKLVNNEAESDSERGSLIRAAELMFSDHPLGIGANHFVEVANMEGYDQKADVNPNSRAIIVHNVYWLVACETGWLGLITFVLLLLRPMIVIVAFLCGLRNRGDRRGDLLLGLGVALLTVYLHNFFEWIFLWCETQYMFAFSVGLIAGLSQQLGYWQRPYRKLSGSPRQAHPYQQSARAAVARDPATHARGRRLPRRGVGT
jgi:hypothetical protein